MRFEGKMVKKPWGMEYCAYDDGQVAIWYLHLRQGHRTSNHYHAKKSTFLRVLSGDATIAAQRPSTHEKYLRPGEMHATIAMSTDVWLMEVETPSDKLDLVRVEDKYGRDGKPYENGENIIDFDSRYAYPSAEFPS